MLTSIMEILARKESLSLAQLAAKAGCSSRELEGYLSQLEHMGYIRREILGQACSPNCDFEHGSSRCEGCGFKSSDSYTFWVLTEKGEALLSPKVKF